MAKLVKRVITQSKLGDIVILTVDLGDDWGAVLLRKANSWKYTVDLTYRQWPPASLGIKTHTRGAHGYLHALEVAREMIAELKAREEWD